MESILLLRRRSRPLAVSATLFAFLQLSAVLICLPYATPLTPQVSLSGAALRGHISQQAKTSDLGGWLLSCSTSNGGIIISQLSALTTQRWYVSHAQQKGMFCLAHKGLLLLFLN